MVLFEEVLGDELVVGKVVDVVLDTGCGLGALESRSRPPSGSRKIWEHLWNLTVGLV